MAWAFSQGRKMFNLKKLLFSILCCYTTIQANALDGASTSGQHYWQFGGHALYLEASPGAVEFDQTLNLDSNLPWSWGFALNAAYQYACNDDILVNWYHYRMQQSQQLQSPISYNNWTLSAAGNNYTYTNLQINHAIIVMNPSWDQVNLEMARTIQWGGINRLRLHAGFNYSHLGSNVSQLLEGSVQAQNQSPRNISQWQSIASSYNGLGLRAGLVLTHDFQNHFLVFADMAGSFLAGSEKTSQLFNEQSYHSVFSRRQMRLVPEFDGRVGTQYDYHLPEGLLSAEISWLWLSYFHALGLEAKKFSLQGLYFGLKWSGNIA